MSEVGCPGLYEDDKSCGICPTCLYRQQGDPRYGSPSDIDTPEVGA
ncbi:hypothetical protein ACFXJ8_26300 [Nonomuraea sp. NPDC059194]